jgi:tetratricopeptide (TPR) repeat protein
MRHRGLAAALLVAAIALVYQGIGAHEFVDFDDFIHIVHNPNLEPGLGVDAVTRAFTTPYGITANWIPLSALSLQLDHSLFGGEASAYHVSNVVLHAASTLLLFFALSGMTGSVWRSAFVAGVFALHPLQVETVAWASERKGVLCGFFFMATLASYSRYVARPGPNWRYATLLLCVAAALLSKPMAVTLPFVLLLLDYWPLRRLGAAGASGLPGGPELSRALLEKLPMLALVAASSVVTLRVQSAAGATGFGEQLSLAARIANALESYGAYLTDAFWPSGLAVFYPHPHFDGVESFLPAAGWALCGVALTAVLLRASRQHGYLAVGWLWFLGMLIPAIGIVAVGFAARADRYMYLPLVGLAIAVAWGVAEFVGREGKRPIALGAVAIACLAALAAMSWLQLQHWRATLPLFEHAVLVTEGNFIAHHRLATAKLFGGRGDESEAHYLESIESGPPRADVYAALADLLAESGRLDEAVAHYQEALRIDPSNARYHTKIGFALLLSEHYAEATPHLEKAATQLGSSTEIHLGLAMAAGGTGDLPVAIEHYRAALASSPGLLGAADSLAWILATSEEVRLLDPNEAIRLAENVTSTRRTPRSLDTLAAAYAASGRFDEAVLAAREAEQLAAGASKPELAEAIRERAAFYENDRPFIDWNSRAIH